MRILEIEERSLVLQEGSRIVSLSFVTDGVLIVETNPTPKKILTNKTFLTYDSFTDALLGQSQLPITDGKAKA